MAEVLITLAIIGVVAAMTIPTLITNYKAKVLETKLQRMYSLMSNAISLSTIDNGETTSWNYKQGDLSTTYSEVLAWYEKYLSPYLKVLEVKQQEGSEDLLIYLLDGSILEIENIIYDMDFYTNEAALKNSKSGANHFFFRFQPTLNESQTDAPEFANVTSPNFNSYGFCWDGTYEGAKHSSCSNGCY
ncbi:type II secretion system protein [bacterium]|nr:type II secretion system protein [bacterium]